MAHNNELPNQHFRKEWDRRVKTWLDQPARKTRRREARKAKAAAIAPRPVGLLRPTVRGQSARYNAKAKQGRGFTLAEIRAAGLTPAAATTIGIAVDHRRQNKSEQSLSVNKERLLKYLATVVIAKKKGKAPVVGVAPGGKAGGLVRAVARKQLPEQAGLQTVHAASAARQAAPAVQFVAVSDAMKGATAFRTLRQEWINMRLAGKRAKVAAEKAAAAEKAEAKKPEE